MKLTIIGCTGSMSGPKSAASCYLLQAQGEDEWGMEKTYSIVFDLGPGSFGQLWNYCDPKELDALVLSHLHADHCGDMISMHVHRKWHPEGSLRVLPVYAPEGIDDRVRGLDGFSPYDDFSTEFDFQQLKQGKTFQVGPMKITPYAAWHSVTAFAFRVEGPSENQQKKTAIFAYSGDTDECDTLVQAAQNSDLLLSECGFTEKDTVRGIHMTGVRAGRIAQYSATRQLVLTHIQPWTAPEIPINEARQTWRGELAVAQSGDIYDI